MTGYRWGTYERISDDRREGAGLGVKRQHKDICAMIATRDPGGVVVDDYADNDISAYSGKRRPAYERLLADIRSGRINAIGAWHNDRLHRSPRELEDFIDLLETYDVHVATVQAGDMDLDTPSGRLIARQFGIIARFESEHKAARIRSKHLELAMTGRSSGGGQRSYGYLPIHDREDKPHKVVYEEIVLPEAQVIRECAKRVLQGESLYSVVADLNARGITTAAGGRWYRTSLARVLASAKIAGQREHRPGTRDGKVPLIGEITGPGKWDCPGGEKPWLPIITPTESARLRRLLADPDRRTSPGPTGRWLCAGGILRCGTCKRPMVGLRRSKSGQDRYICIGEPGHKDGTHVSIVAAGTDYVVTGWVSARVSVPAFRKALQRRDGRPDESILLEDIAAAEHQQEELAEEWAEGGIERAGWRAADKALQRRIDRARAQLSTDSATVVLDGLPANAKDLQAFLLDADVPVSRRRAVIRTLLDHVTVEPAGKAGRQKFDIARLTPEWKV